MQEKNKSENKLFQKITGYILVIAVIAILTGVFVEIEQRGKDSHKNPGKYAEDINEGILYQVTKVLDGDTLVANVSGHEVTVRLIGIDTPEVVDPRKPVQCYGPEASAKAKEMLSGKSIYLEKEASKGNYDIYGRVLAYVKFSDGSLYGQDMIEQGYAREYTFNKEKYKYQSQFKKSQATAKKARLGLWGKCPASS